MNDPQKIIDSYNPVFLACRANNHRWDKSAKWNISGDGHYVEKKTICMDCGTVKRKVYGVASNGILLPTDRYSRYVYPRGYQTKRSGLGKRDFVQRDIQEDINRW